MLDKYTKFYTNKHNLIFYDFLIFSLDFFFVSDV